MANVMFDLSALSSRHDGAKSGKEEKLAKPTGSEVNWKNKP